MVKPGNGRNARRTGQGSIDVNYRAALLISIVLPLAACGSKPAVNEKNASVEEVTQKVREVSRDEGLIRPGKWESTVTIDRMEMPGMPPQVASQMKKMIAEAHTSSSCLTPEEAKQPKENFFSGNKQCRYDHFTMGHGKVDAEMHCDMGTGTQVMQMAGTYSPESYQMSMKSSGDGAGNGMTMQMSVNARRVGECTGKED